MREPAQIHFDFRRHVRGTQIFQSPGFCYCILCLRNWKILWGSPPPPILLLKIDSLRKALCSGQNSCACQIGIIELLRQSMQDCAPKPPQTPHLPCTGSLCPPTQETAPGQHCPPAAALTCTNWGRAALLLAVFLLLQMFLNPKSHETAPCGCVTVTKRKCKCSEERFYSGASHCSSHRCLLSIPASSNLEVQSVSLKTMLLFPRSSGFQSGWVRSG